MEKAYRAVNSRTLADINRANEQLNAPVQDAENPLERFHGVPNPPNTSRSVPIGTKVHASEVKNGFFVYRGGKWKVKKLDNEWYAVTGAAGEDSLIPHPPLIREMLHASGVEHDVAKLVGEYHSTVQGVKVYKTPPTRFGILYHTGNPGSAYSTPEQAVEASKKSSEDASSSPFEQSKQKLESSGHKAAGTHSTGATIYRHPKESGSVLLTKEGHVLANE